MHEQMTHDIAIRAPWQRVYQMCITVERWPEWFAPCQSVEILEQDAAHQRMQICALANGTPMTWISHRTLCPQERRIDFTQETPKAPITRLGGAWEFQSTAPHQTLLRLHHDVRVDPRAPTATATMTQMLRAIDRNSVQELAAMKQIAEQNPSRTFTDVATITASASRVFALLYQVEQWPRILPHCAGTTIRYDDGTHQELVMCVDTPHGREEIRTIRTATAPTRIAYFQPTPPAPLRTHTGAWNIESIGDAVVVCASHHITIERSLFDDDAANDAALHRAESAIRQNSCLTLAALARAVEEA